MIEPFEQPHLALMLMQVPISHCARPQCMFALYASVRAEAIQSIAIPTRRADVEQAPPEVIRLTVKRVYQRVRLRKLTWEQ